jgi:hypothetical protein
MYIARVNAAADTFVQGMGLALSRANESMQAAQQRQREQANRSRRDESYKLGETVLLSAKNITF